MANYRRRFGLLCEGCVVVACGLQPRKGAQFLFGSMTSNFYKLAVERNSGMDSELSNQQKTIPGGAFAPEYPILRARAWQTPCIIGKSLSPPLYPR